MIQLEVVGQDGSLIINIAISIKERSRHPRQITAIKLVRVVRNR